MFKNILFCLSFVMTIGCATMHSDMYVYKPTQKSRMEYLNAHPAIAGEIKDGIASGVVFKGMTGEQVKAIYGDPCVREKNGYHIWTYAYRDKNKALRSNSRSCFGDKNYVLKDDIVVFLSVYEFEKMQDEKNEADRKTDAYNKRKAYVQQHKNLPEKIRKAILEEKIMLGMSADDVKTSWGDPKNINRSVGSWGVHEQWVYSGTYVYFENGKLTSWQN